MANHTTETYIKAAVQALDSKRGEDIQVLKVGDLTTLAEYFVICAASTTTQVKTLADEVEFRLKKDYDVMPHHIEGHDSASWILLDYGFALIHVFQQSARDFYGLEKLWKDAVQVPIEEL
ncbi:MAG TPA: ribosome silencing factor [Clostridiales bacterium]|nr:ribosome silencing factor [Clostridiales bacterium]